MDRSLSANCPRKQIKMFRAGQHCGKGLDRGMVEHWGLVGQKKCQGLGEGGQEAGSEIRCYVGGGERGFISLIKRSFLDQQSLLHQRNVQTLHELCI